MKNFYFFVIKVVAFSFKKRFLFFVLLAGISGLLAIEILLGTTIRQTYWEPVLSPYIGIGTFFAAFAAWFGTVRRDWLDQLPKRLSVDFIYDDKGDKKMVMQCNYASLSGEADIRAMGQQIGAQMSAGLLVFNVAQITWHEEKKIIFTESQLSDIDGPIKGEGLEFPFRHYHVTYPLTSLPKNLKAGVCYIWNPPFNPVLNAEDQQALEQQEKQKALFEQGLEKCSICKTSLPKECPGCGAEQSRPRPLPHLQYNKTKSIPSSVIPPTSNNEANDAGQQTEVAL